MNKKQQLRKLRKAVDGINIKSAKKKIEAHCIAVDINKALNAKVEKACGKLGLNVWEFAVGALENRVEDVLGGIRITYRCHRHQVEAMGRRIAALKGVITKQKGWLAELRIITSIQRRKIMALRSLINRPKKAVYRKQRAVLLDTLDAGAPYLYEGRLFIVGYDCDGDMMVDSGEIVKRYVDVCHVVPLTKKGFSIEILKLM